MPVTSISCQLFMQMRVRGQRKVCLQSAPGKSDQSVSHRRERSSFDISWAIGPRHFARKTVCRQGYDKLVECESLGSIKRPIVVLNLGKTFGLTCWNSRSLGSGSGIYQTHFTPYASLVPVTGFYWDNHVMTRQVMSTLSPLHLLFALFVFSAFLTAGECTLLCLAHLVDELTSAMAWRPSSSVPVPASVVVCPFTRPILSLISKDVILIGRLI